MEPRRRGLARGTALSTKIRNPKSEIRSKSQIQNCNVQNWRGQRLSNMAYLNFEFVSGFGFWGSGFSSFMIEPMAPWRGPLAHDSLPGLRRTISGRAPY